MEENEMDRVKQRYTELANALGFTNWKDLLRSLICRSTR